MVTERINGSDTKITVTPIRVSLKYGKTASTEERNEILQIAVMIEARTRDITSSFRGKIKLAYPTVTLYDKARTGQLNFRIRE